MVFFIIYIDVRYVFKNYYIEVICGICVYYKGDYKIKFKGEVNIKRISLFVWFFLVVFNMFLIWLFSVFFLVIDVFEKWEVNIIVCICNNRVGI